MKTKVLQRLLFILLGCLPMSSLHAGSEQGVITSLVVQASDGLTHFTLDGTPTGKPGCATQSYWIIADEDSATGKRQLGLLLVAHASRRTINVTGFGTCNRVFDGEDLDVLEIL